MNSNGMIIPDWSKRAPVWGGLGTDISGLTNIDEVLTKADLAWNVLEKPLMTEDGIPLPGYKATIRDIDNYPLGVVSNNYEPLNNRDCYLFLQELIRYGFEFQLAGMFQNGRKTWVLLKTPEDFIVNNDQISEYIVCINSHDGSSSMKIVFTPIRCICSNMLTITLRNATRSFSFKHTATIQERMHTAIETMDKNAEYMERLRGKMKSIGNINLPRFDVVNMVNELLPIPDDATDLRADNVRKLRNDIVLRYDTAPDLRTLPETGYRFINALTDHFTHVEPLRMTANYQEKLFNRTLEHGMSIVDKGLRLLA